MEITRDLFARIWLVEASLADKQPALAKQLLSMQLPELVIASIWLEDKEARRDRWRMARWDRMSFAQETAN